MVPDAARAVLRLCLINFGLDLLDMIERKEADGKGGRKEERNDTRQKINSPIKVK